MNIQEQLQTEIIQQLFKIEKKQHLTLNIIDPDLHLIIMQCMHDMCMYLNLLNSTIFLAMELYINLITKINNKYITDLQFEYAIVCIMIAIKLDSEKKYKTDDFNLMLQTLRKKDAHLCTYLPIRIIDKYFSSLETEILKTLNFDILLVTPYDFLHYLIYTSKYELSKEQLEIFIQCVINGLYIRTYYPKSIVSHTPSEFCIATINYVELYVKKHKILNFHEINNIYERNVVYFENINTLINNIHYLMSLIGNYL